jgi:16S rRNA (cytosine1402-N4)-methyltransferase
MAEFFHKPVLLRETVNPLLENRGIVYVDCTLGGGGHLSFLLESKPNGVVYAFDQDLNMIERAGTRFQEMIQKGRLHLVHSNYANIRQRLAELGVNRVDGIILDAGVSSFQIDMPERGFSFARRGPLDMRMDQTQPLTAYQVVNQWPREHLEKIFFQYGEEKFSRKITYRIIEARERSPIEDTLTLASIVEDCLPRLKGKGIHPATRVFQAIRIAVNRELEGLENFLKEIPSILNPHGVVSVISFHSLEDRLVKERFKELSSHCICPPQIMTCARCGHPPGVLLQKKPIIPSDEEIATNPRARSAKLRVFIRNTEPILSAPDYGSRK